jgi:hypothetical protein
MGILPDAAPYCNDRPKAPVEVVNALEAIRGHAAARLTPFCEANRQSFFALQAVSMLHNRVNCRKARLPMANVGQFGQRAALALPRSALEETCYS